jgi:hypothetical protein
VSPETDRAALESRSATSSVAHLQELLYDPMPEFEVIERVDRRVVISVGTHSLASDVARRLGGPDIVGARVEGDQVVVELASSGAAERFDLEQVGLEGGSHQLGPVALMLIPREGTIAPLQLVPNPIERHWRLLNGGHVDIVPKLHQAEAERLAGLSSIEAVRLPTTDFLALVVGSNLSPAARAHVASSVDVGAISSGACGSDCTADLPVDGMAEAQAPTAPERPLELIYLDGTDAEAIAARLISHQLREAGIELRIVPVELERLTAYSASGKFDLALLPMPTNPEHFRLRLKYSKISEDQLASSIIPLFENRFYAAYDTSICGVEPDSATSWDWLAGAYRCEDPSL